MTYYTKCHSSSNQQRVIIEIVLSVELRLLCIALPVNVLYLCTKFHKMFVSQSSTQQWTLTLFGCLYIMIVIYHYTVNALYHCYKFH